MLRTLASIQTIKNLYPIEGADLITMSVGYSKLNDKTIREGVVIRPLDYKFEHKIGRVSFKIINPQFSLKWE